MAAYGAMDGPAIKSRKGGTNVAVYTVQWMVQLSKVARRTKCGSIQYNALSSYYTWVAKVWQY